MSSSPICLVASANGVYYVNSVDHNENSGKQCSRAEYKHYGMLKVAVCVIAFLFGLFISL